MGSKEFVSANILEKKPFKGLLNSLLGTNMKCTNSNDWGSAKILQEVDLACVRDHISPLAQGTGTL